MQMNKNSKECPACAYNNKPLPPSIIKNIYRFYDEHSDNPRLEDLPYKSDIKVHWRCRVCGLKWESPLSERVRENGKGYVINGCPNCSARKKDNYAGRNPILASMYSDNNPVPMEELTKPDRMRNQLWICPTCGTEFKRTLNYMIKNQHTELKGCPNCINRNSRIENSFGDVHPELIAEYDKSNNISIFMVGPQSHKTAKWICPNGHKWENTFLARHLGMTCPECKKSSSLQSLFVDISKQWSPSNDTTPDSVRADSTTRALWICEDCGTEFKSTIADMTSGKTTCPCCGDNPRLAYQNTELLKYWDHEENTADPYRVIVNSNAVYKMKCSLGHKFEMSLADISKFIEQDRSPCPYCDNRRVLAGFNSLADTHPELEKYWGKNNDKAFNEIAEYHSYDAHWLCPECGGMFTTEIRKFVAGDYDCPYCNEVKILPGLNSFKVKYPNLMKEWDWVSNYVLVDPDKVSPASKETAWWNCPKGHTYKMPINQRVMFDYRNITACPYCKGRNKRKSHFYMRKGETDYE